MNTTHPSRPVHAADGRPNRVRLVLVLAVISVPTAASREVVAAAKAALLDRVVPNGRPSLLHGAAAARVFTSPGE